MVVDTNAISNYVVNFFFKVNVIVWKFNVFNLNWTVKI